MIIVIIIANFKTSEQKLPKLKHEKQAVNKGNRPQWPRQKGIPKTVA